MNPRLLLLLAAHALACSSAGDPAPVVLGAASATVRVSADARTITLLRGDAKLLEFPADAFALGLVPDLDDNLSYDPYWLESNPPRGLEFVSPTGAKVVRAEAKRVEVALAYDGLTARLTIAAEAPGRFRATLVPGEPEGGQVAYLRLRPRAAKDEAFYGLGEWPDSVNHRGFKRPMQIEADLPFESASTENHVPVPFLIGTRGWGLFVESRRVGLFDVATQSDELVEVTYGTAAASADGLTFHLFASAHPLDVTRHYYDVTGDPLLPAPWALGPWIWRDENRDEAQVREDVAKIRELDLATSGYWIDRPYATKVNTFDFDADQFPDPEGMVATLHAAGLRVALWHTPYLEPGAEPMLSEAKAKGYFVPEPGLLLNKWSIPIDFTNPAAFEWWQGLVRRYTALGIEGFKLDYAEDVQPGIAGARGKWGFHDGSDERTMQHDYQLLYHRAYAETLPGTGGFLLCRAGRWGDQKNVSVIWPGDLDANFAKHGDPIPGSDRRYVGGLPASVVMGLSLGPSGFPFYGADTGGYRHSPPDREVFVRWFQQTALSTVMQVGNSDSDVPWEFNARNGRDEESLGWYRTYARLHLRLFPYEWTYAKNLAKDGRAIQRPLGLAYPELGVHPGDTYLFGDHLLVAPVVTKGAVTRALRLPPGDWLDWWDGTRHPGGATGQDVEVPAPLSKLPLFLRAGGIVPMLRPTIDTLAPATLDGVESYANDAGLLYVRIAPGPDRTEFTLFDGTRIARQQTASKESIEYHSAAATTFRKGAMLEVLATATAVTLDGAPLAKQASVTALEGAASGWAADEATGGTTWIRVPPGGHAIDLK